MSKEAKMDKVIFSICKNGMDLYILEDKVGNKTYKFNDFSEIIGIFSKADHPTLPSSYRVVMPTTQEDKINIYQRVNKSGTKALPKYFWSQSHNIYDQIEQVSIREVLKHIKGQMNGW
jgi:hypothetical protein